MGKSVRRKTMRQDPLSGNVQMVSPFGKGYKPSTPAQTLAVLPSQFDSLLELCAELSKVEFIYGEVTTKINSINTVLSVNEIQTFLELSAGLENLPRYTEILGYVATQLIRNACNNGEVLFRFDLRNLKPLVHFASYLTRGNPTYIIRGHLGRNALNGSSG